jgi:ferric-dicitrate binding protein FerR (iron transport regulator)
MNRFDRKEAAVRELLEGTPPPVPPELYAESVRLGRRMLRRRRAVRRLLWALLCAAVVAFTMWALAARPWTQPPSDTTPAVTDR